MTGRGRGRRDDERGIALLIVLLTITLLTIIVVEFTQSAEVETHFALSSRNALQAVYLARSGVNVGEALLIADARLNHYDAEDELNVWAKPFPPLPVGDGTVALRIQDEARRLNLNAMVGPDGPRQRAIFARLFDVLGIDKRVLAAIIDWIDADHEPTTDPAPGAEQPYYLGLVPAVVVRDGPMLTMRELMQIRGMTPTLYARLEEFVTVLPPTRDAFKVNVNTAPAEVLYALSPGLMSDPGVVDRLIATRRAQPIQHLPELDEVTGFKQALGVSNYDESPLDYQSKYFRIDAVGEVNEDRKSVV